MKRLGVAAWSVVGWACLLGLENWYLAAGAWCVAGLIGMCKK